MTSTRILSPHGLTGTIVGSVWHADQCGGQSVTLRSGVARRDIASRSNLFEIAGAGRGSLQFVQRERRQRLADHLAKQADGVSAAFALLRQRGADRSLDPAGLLRG